MNTGASIDCANGIGRSTGLEGASLSFAGAPPAKESLGP
jgi:hypothetical protein